MNELGDIGAAVRGCREVATEVCGKQCPPGLSVAVVKPGGNIWSEGFGLAATAVMQLAERGRLDLDDPVTECVPEFRKSDDGTHATIRHLLSHSAGMANPIPVRLNTANGA